jgi:two-component system CheB/CheR fusion protein
MNIFAMARGELRNELTSALRTASRQKNKVVTRNAEVRTNGRTQHVNLTVQIIEEPETLRGMAIIVFTDVATPRDEKRKTVRNKLVSVSNARLAKLEQELRQVREELLITREEMYTSQEELTSTNEELQSTNEELQSTNEELSTSKEEMQSMNEELQTVNCELQVKLDEFSKTSNDMKNLLESTDIAILFLDKKLNVRRYTAQTTKIIKLIPGDVGRPLADLTTALLYPELIEDLQEVMRTLVFTEKQITSHDGQEFVVRVMPYRTLEDIVDGVVITFRDILKRLQPAGVIKKEMRPEKR